MTVPNRLKILKSDLKDTQNPKILAKYPHLGNPKHIEQLKQAIQKLEEG